MAALIIGCEIAFWLFVLAGLACRYLAGFKKTGAFLLLCTPVIDLALLVAAAIDLRGGAEATMFHGIAAVYIGVSVVFGHSMIKWADARFARRFAGGPPPRKKAGYGKEHARNERIGWFRHALAWAMGCAILYGLTAMVGDEARTDALMKAIRLWSIVLGIDFIVSFSYTLWPKRPKGQKSV